MDAHIKLDDFERIIADVDDLRETFEPHIVEMEELCCLPAPIVDKLKEIGIFRMWAPKQFGGQELEFPTGAELIRRIAAIDGSIGWVAAINSGGCLMLPNFPLASLEAIYRTGPDQIIAGNGHSLGSATRVAGGWRVSGRWPLASGCKDAHWIAGGFAEQEPQGDSGGHHMRVMLQPAKEFNIEETWRAMGLRGTGSHHVSIEEAFVAEGFVTDFANADSSIDGPLYRNPIHFVPLTHSAVQLGIAEAALVDIVELQQARLNGDASGRRELAYFQLGTCNAKLKAAQAMFERQVISNWSDAVEGRPADPKKLNATMQTAAFVAAETLEIVRCCFEMAGSASVYETSALQRRLRDIQVATQHGAVQRTNLMAGGKALFEGAQVGLLTNVRSQTK